MNVTLITDLQGTELAESERSWLTSPHLGGIILFSRNYESRDQLVRLIADIKSVNSNLLITVDHEGGRVQRFRHGFTHVASMGQIGEQLLDEARQCATAAAITLAYELRELGVDLTYAPVMDLDYGNNQVIGDRSFSSDPQVVTQLALSFIEGLQQMQMVAVGKHFPGHGWVTADSHLASPVDNRTYNQIKNSDLIPFSQLMEQLEWLMPAHVIYPQVCDQPAGFSSIWLHDILRGQFSYQGRIVSDDLSMAGAAVKGGYEQRALSATNAGCDILLACNDPKASVSLISWLDENQNTPLSLAKYMPPKLTSEDKDLYLDAVEMLKRKGLTNES